MFVCLVYFFFHSLNSVSFSFCSFFFFLPNHHLSSLVFFLLGRAKCSEGWCASDAIRYLQNTGIPHNKCLKKSIDTQNPDYDRKCEDFEVIRKDSFCRLVWRIDQSPSKTGYVIDALNMKRAIMKTGPIVTRMRIPKRLLEDKTYDGSRVQMQQKMNYSFSFMQFIFFPCSQVFQLNKADRAQFDLEDNCVSNRPGCSEAPIYHFVVNGGWGAENGVKYWIILNSWGNAYQGKFTFKRTMPDFTVQETTFNHMPNSRGFLRVAMDPLLEMENLSYVIEPVRHDLEDNDHDVADRESKRNK